MSYVIVLAAFIVGMFGVHKASDHQQRSLQAKCHCTCVRTDDDVPQDSGLRGPDEAAPTPVFDEWLAKFGTGELTMAWGGGYWRCAVRP